MLNTAPVARPNSGAYWCVFTTRSRTTSCEKEAFGDVPLVWSLLSRPSTRNAFARPDWPFTMNTVPRSP
jgi:hypothetical protein